jgi:hypothetical protein
MRIALFFVAFTLGAGLAAGLAAADATPPRPSEPGATVVVPRPATSAAAPIRVQPVRFEGRPAVDGDSARTGSTWTPGLGEGALAVVAVATVGGALVARRRALVPVRA